MHSSARQVFSETLLSQGNRRHRANAAPAMQRMPTLLTAPSPKRREPAIQTRGFAHLFRRFAAARWNSSGRGLRKHETSPAIPFRVAFGRRVAGRPKNKKGRQCHPSNQSRSATRTSTQTGDVVCHRANFRITHPCSDRLHHPIRVVAALARAEGLQLRFGVFGVLSRETRILRR
jgi:hypothetical protein